MTAEQIIICRMISPERHLCSNCNRLYTANEPQSTGTTTQDLHVCKHRYCPGVETEDNGGGYWVTKCPKYIQIDTRGIYSEWMQDMPWKEIAAKAKKKAGYKCEICGSAMNLCVHHTTYENICREDQHPDDLVVVCRNCHANIHDEDLKKAAEKRKQKKRQEWHPRDDFGRFWDFCIGQGKAKEFMQYFHDMRLRYESMPELPWIAYDWYMLDFFKEFGYTPSQEWESESLWNERRTIYNKVMREEQGWTEVDPVSGCLVGRLP